MLEQLQEFIVFNYFVLGQGEKFTPFSASQANTTIYALSGDHSYLCKWKTKKL